MKLAIMQPYFFPYLGYFQAIAAVDKYILYENFNFPTEGWMSRNRLLAKNQNTFFINAPIKEKSPNKKINEIELVKDSFWKKKLLKTIHLNYSRSKYFKDVYHIIEEIICNETPFLHQFNSNGIRVICNFLDIKTHIVSDNSNYLNLELELENFSSDIFSEIKFEKKTSLLDKKVVRILAICKAENAKTYINAIGGRSFYEKKIFELNGIDLYFVETQNYFYDQFSLEFIPHLSIIDVLMHNGKEGTKELLKNYNLI